MIKKNILVRFAAYIALSAFIFVGCSKDDSNNEPTPIPTPVEPLKTTYTLKAKDILGVSGSVTIAEKTSGGSESVVTIHLTGAPAGVHPAHIHMNSAIETGNIAYNLNSVSTGDSSSTTLSVTYNTLINYDGYVNVHLDTANMGTIIAQADIGGNQVTSTNKIYTLAQDSSSGIAGSAKFEKRKNGTTLLTINLTSGATLPPGLYPAQINLGSVSTVGTPVKTKTLNPVDGTSRISITNIRTLDNLTAITYANWLVYDGFLTIHDAADTTNIIAKGNIGSN